MWGIRVARKGAKHLRGFRKSEPNTHLSLPKSAEDNLLSCSTWQLWLGQSPSAASASSPVQGQEELRSKFLWDVEGKQSEDALSSLPGAAVGKRMSAPKQTGQQTETEEG